jgi:hypothetical protein
MIACIVSELERRIQHVVHQNDNDA